MLKTSRRWEAHRWESAAIRSLACIDAGFSCITHTHVHIYSTCRTSAPSDLTELNNVHGAYHGINSSVEIFWVICTMDTHYINYIHHTTLHTRVDGTGAWARSSLLSTICFSLSFGLFHHYLFFYHVFLFCLAFFWFPYLLTFFIFLTFHLFPCHFISSSLLHLHSLHLWLHLFFPVFSPVLFFTLFMSSCFLLFFFSLLFCLTISTCIFLSLIILSLFHSCPVGWYSRKV